MRDEVLLRQHGRVREEEQGGLGEFHQEQPSPQFRVLLCLADPLAVDTTVSLLKRVVQALDFLGFEK